MYYVILVAVAKRFENLTHVVAGNKKYQLDIQIIHFYNTLRQFKSILNAVILITSIRKRIAFTGSFKQKYPRCIGPYHFSFRIIGRFRPVSFGRYFVQGICEETQITLASVSFVLSIHTMRPLRYRRIRQRLDAPLRSKDRSHPYWR